MANRTTDPGSESEWLTRKRRVDPLLDAAGWPRRKGKASPASPKQVLGVAMWKDDGVDRLEGLRKSRADARKSPQGLRAR